MSSPYTNDRTQLCGHENHRIGCIACALHYQLLQRKQYEAEYRRTQGIMSAFAHTATHAKLEEEREAAKEELQKCQSRIDAVMDRLELIGATYNSLIRRVQNICSGESDLSSGYRLIKSKLAKLLIENSPDALAGAFEKDAAECETALLRDWANGATTMKQKSFPKVKREDPARESSYTGLDRTTITSTPDYLLGAPIGFQIFLRHARGRNPPHPNSAIGRKPGPAIASYGKVCAMLGGPSEPGEDWPEEKKLEEGMAKLGVSPDTSIKATRITTEAEYRQQSQTTPPTVSILSVEEQWALFGEKRFMIYTDLLAREYVARVAEQQRLEDSRTKEPKKSAEVTPPAPTTGPGGWPAVEGLDFNGFTNWVSRCEAADKNFLAKTLPTWDAEKSRRYELRTSLGKWNLAAAKKQGYDDGSSEWQKEGPDVYWSGPTIGELDAPKGDGFRLRKPNGRG
ncbi:hypothetical protein D6D08_09174 [Aureobasidium pullulans]|nr:hypothetical protein D6D08_09174 [Aureobasidium pullulans]